LEICTSSCSIKSGFLYNLAIPNCCSVFTQWEYFSLYFCVVNLIHLLNPSQFLLRLAVRSVGLLGNNTLIDEINVRPVVSLGTLTINSSSRVGNSSPERTTSDILLPSVTLGVEESLAGSDVQSVVVHSLPGEDVSTRSDECGLGEYLQ
jgi:hypothetical protein